MASREILNPEHVAIHRQRTRCRIGLDYFGARYFSAAQGRFTSPDEFKGGIVDPFTGQDVETNRALPYADITDPQTLNKYVYVRNNPLRYVDPDGHDLGDAFDVLVGVGRGIASSITYGYWGSVGSRTGQAIGTAWVASEGVNLAIGGGTAAVVTAPTVVGAAAGTAVAGAGVALSVGAAKNMGAILNTPMESRGMGPKAKDAPGVTANGQATDKYDNKLGPSSEVQVNGTRSNTREAARNKALNEGSGAVNHNNPKDGQPPHFQPTDAKGRKIPSSTHHYYPE